MFKKLEMIENRFEELNMRLMTPEVINDHEKSI